VATSKSLFRGQINGSFGSNLSKKLLNHYTEHHPHKEKMHMIVIGTFLWGDLSQSEKVSEIKPPLKTWTLMKINPFLPKWLPSQRVVAIANSWILCSRI
jgi:hypothetical protein